MAGLKQDCKIKKWHGLSICLEQEIVANNRVVGFLCSSDSNLGGATMQYSVVLFHCVNEGTL